SSRLVSPLRSVSRLAAPCHRESSRSRSGNSSPRAVSLRRLGGDGCGPRRSGAPGPDGGGGGAMSWLSPTALLAVVLGSLVFLFAVASAGEAFAGRLTRGRLRTVTYVLAASVYCTAWTFYGSVGLAANRGLEFLTIYLGPACVAVLWPLLLRKLV